MNIAKKELLAKANKMCGYDLNINHFIKVINKANWRDWCNLIAWLLNCDELCFSALLERKTSDDIWKSNSNGELMFVGESIGFLTDILEQIIEVEDLGTTKPLVESIFDILDGKEIEPDGKYGSGFGLKCRTILWTCEKDYIEKVNKLLKDTWGAKND